MNSYSIHNTKKTHRTLAFLGGKQRKEMHRLNQALRGHGPAVLVAGGFAMLGSTDRAECCGIVGVVGQPQSKDDARGFLLEGLQVCTPLANWPQAMDSRSTRLNIYPRSIDCLRSAVSLLEWHINVEWRRLSRVTTKRVPEQELTPRDVWWVRS